MEGCYRFHTLNFGFICCDVTVNFPSPVIGNANSRGQLEYINTNEEGASLSHQMHALVYIPVFPAHTSAAV